MAEPVSYSSETVAVPPSRGVKIPAGVVTILVLAALAGGAWYVWDTMFATHNVDASLYESNDSPAAIARSRFYDQPTTTPTGAITHNPDGTGDIRVGAASCRFTKNGSAIDAALTYQNLGFAAPDDRFCNGARFMALFNKTASTAAGVTADQIAKLKPLTVPSNIPVTDGERKDLVALWAQYGSAADADKPAIANKFENELRRLAAAGIDPAARAYADYAAKIRAILSEEQINKLRPQRGRMRQQPTPPPASAPAK